jgi:hypothetical protein
MHQGSCCTCSAGPPSRRDSQASSISEPRALPSAQTNPQDSQVHRGECQGPRTHREARGVGMLFAEPAIAAFSRLRNPTSGSGNFCNSGNRS